MAVILLPLLLLSGLHGLQTHNRKTIPDKSRLATVQRFAGLINQPNQSSTKTTAADHTGGKKGRRHKTSLVRTDAGENIHEPELEVVEAELSSGHEEVDLVVDRNDHEELPDFADFPTQKSVAAEVLSAKEIFRTESERVEVKTQIKVVRNTVKESSKSVVETTLVVELARTATVMLTPEIHRTTVTPTINKVAMRQDVTQTPHPHQNNEGGGADGWILFTPGAPQNHEKNDDQGVQSGTPHPTATSAKKYLQQGDALPDALQLISDLWNDVPVFVTETLYFTTKLMRTPTPAAGNNKAGVAATTTSRLRKWEKTGKPTSTSRFVLNTGLFHNDALFSIADNDIYRGAHAQQARNEAHTAATNVILLAFCCIIGVLLFV